MGLGEFFIVPSPSCSKARSLWASDPCSPSFHHYISSSFTTCFTLRLSICSSLYSSSSWIVFFFLPAFSLIYPDFGCGVPATLWLYFSMFACVNVCYLHSSRERKGEECNKTVNSQVSGWMLTNWKGAAAPSHPSSHPLSGWKEPLQSHFSHILTLFLSCWNEIAEKSDDIFTLWLLWVFMSFSDFC